MDKETKWQYAKVLISACGMIAASMGLCFYGAGAYYDALSSALGVSLGQSSMMTMFFLIFMALGALVIGWLQRKADYHKLLIGGTLACALSVLAMGFCFNIGTIYFFSCVEGLGAALIGMVPAMAMINNWFDRRKPLASSVALCASALAAAAFSPFFTLCVENLGWRMSFVVQAMVITVLMLPALLWKVPLSPVEAGTLAYGQIHDENHDKKISMPGKVMASLAVIAILSSALTGMPMHFSSYATSLSKSLVVGGQMLSMAMLGNIVFKLAGGFLTDHIKPVLTAGILDLVALAATIGFMICTDSVSDGVLLWISFFFGSCYGISELTLPLLVSGQVGKHHFTPVYALMNFLTSLTTAIVIPVIGFMYDGTRSYFWVFFLCLMFEILILLMVVYMIYEKTADEAVMTKHSRKFIENRRNNAEKRKANRQAASMAADDANAQSDAQRQSVFEQQMTLIDEEPEPDPLHPDQTVILKAEEETKPEPEDNTEQKDE